MSNPILDENIPQALIQQAVKSSKQTVVVKQSAEQGYTFNLILDTAADINFSTRSDKTTEQKLTVGSIKQAKIDNDDFLALLLDPEDVSALIESNIQQDSDHENDVLFSAPNQSVLKLEDVLHKEDSLDEYLPPSDKDKWYLFGDGDAIDKAISSPGMQDIHDALLMQQLMVENYVEK